MTIAEILERMGEDEGQARHFEEALRLAEALLFASREPLGADVLAERMPSGIAIAQVLEALQALYAQRGVNLIQVAGKWAFRTASDLAGLLLREQEEQKRLSRAALETLAVVAYHQPATRAEIEDIRGISTAKGTLDILLEAGWVRMRGRRKSPGRPITYGTTPDFLEHFSLATLDDLPGLQELKGAGFFDAALPPGFSVPQPNDGDALRPDEDPLEDAPLLDLDAAEPDDTPAAAAG